MNRRELEGLCGDLLVVGFPGTSLDPDTKQALADRRRAGVILFKRNVESVEQVHALCTEIVKSVGDDHGPFVGVDQEGGRVMRIPAPAMQLPPLRAVGAQGPAFARRVGSVLGAELFAMGFNVDFAPVLDVDSNPANPIIGDRAFGLDPVRVAELGIAFVEGLQAGGVMACGKHFPGHGDTEKDSHVDLPRVRHGRDRLDEVELVPFRRLAPYCASFMTAHVVYDALAPDVPATLSPAVVTELLRREIGYTGLVFSDDLEMRALADRYTVEESAVAAVRAGCDVLLVCSSFELAERAHAALAREAEADDRFRSRCAEAASRSRELRRKYPARPAPTAAALGRALAESGAAGVLAELKSGAAR